MFIGIDQSLTATGVCLLPTTGAPQVLQTLTMRHQKDGDRLAAIWRALQPLIGQATHAAMEGYAYNATGRVFELGEVGGLVKTLCTLAGVPYVVVPPLVLKKYATQHGGASKLAMVTAARNAGAEVHDDNQADAFFLASLARDNALGTAKLRHVREAVHSVQAPRPAQPSKKRSSVSRPKTRPSATTPNV